MGNLFDELKKAKLIDKKKAKQLAHEQRVEKSAKGGDRAADAERAAKDAEHKKRLEEQRRRDREREQARQRREREREQRLQIQQLVASRQLSDLRGSRRWHFVTPSGSVPYVPVDEQVGRRLEAGELAVVLDPNVEHARYVIVPREVALELEAQIADSICSLAGRS